MKIGYVTLGSRDIPRAAKFYDALSAEMGTARMMGSEEENFIAWGEPGGAAGLGILKPHDGGEPSVGNGVMVAFEASGPEQVKRLYEIALAQGGTDEGAPGDRGGGFYAAYFRDLDGHKLNAFCMTAAE